MWDSCSFRQERDGHKERADGESARRCAQRWAEGGTAAVCVVACAVACVGVYIYMCVCCSAVPVAEGESVGMRSSLKGGGSGTMTLGGCIVAEANRQAVGNPAKTHKRLAGAQR